MKIAIEYFFRSSLATLATFPKFHKIYNFEMLYSFMVSSFFLVAGILKNKTLDDKS